MRIISRHKKTPALAGDGVLGNESNYQERNVMANISTTASNVIPFRFEAKEVRTLLVNDQPWFVAADVCGSLAIGNVSLAVNGRADRESDGLDQDEKGIATVNTPSGAQEMLVVNESGLYSLIFKSRKGEAKRFKKWVTSEVLPAIRKHGHFIDHSEAMGDLIGSVIGTSGEHVLDRVIDQKASPVAKGLQRSFRHTMKSRLRSRFNVQRTALIPAECLADACNFVAAYALEGEFIAREIEQSKDERLNINFPLTELIKRRPEMLTIRNSEQAWLDVSMQDLCSRPQDLSLCEKALCELRDNGYDIEGAWFEVRSLRNRLGELNSFLTGLGVAMQHPTRYAVDVEDAA